MAHGSPVHKLYKSVIEDVIEGVRELFAEEGLEEQVLKDLKQLWEIKVMQSKATEGFFRHSHRSAQFALQLPHSFHHVLQASAASLVIPAGRGFQQFTAADLSASQVGATLTLPSGIAYPIHVPAGVTLQTASGQLYKVNLPVVVTQAAGDASVLHHPVQQVLQPPGQPSVLQANIASVAQVNASSAQADAETLQPQETAIQQTMVFQPNAMEKNHLENSASTTLVQQPSVNQQQLVTNAVLNQSADSTEKSQYGSLHTAVFMPESSEGFFPTESLANTSSSVLLDVEGQLDIESQELVQQPVSDDIIDLIITGKSLDDSAVLKDHDVIASSDKMEPTEQMESNLRSEKDICSDIGGIIQLDGTGDVSPKEEIPYTKDREENEFIGIIESEDLKALDDEEDDDEEYDSVSNTESSSSGGDNEEAQTDIVEEDPLNSGDDVSEQDIPDLFDTDNVIVCQYDKIHRSKNKWKFYLKDGVMSFEGRDHVFAKAIGDAEW
ncbi:TFIIA-alpha and beta-like factor [Falco biarmicus]|uniref:TFIIA-alpha and beta-like factor n=1 Tax=Falco rusticolus TaxID=120794 RepID=UPI0018866358|nr:TFIIA-alpha and beta-like factor [Falco rusticolus]XP_055581402.1 TFIIA-alpha and beta-like factor [Falco cherrug]XP_056212828.1 TFIIA-alpha and beta-like factor [Falco biarmicus]